MMSLKSPQNATSFRISSRSKRDSFYPYTLLKKVYFCGKIANFFLVPLQFHKNRDLFSFLSRSMDIVEIRENALIRSRLPNKKREVNISRYF